MDNLIEVSGRGRDPGEDASIVDRALAEILKTDLMPIPMGSKLNTICPICGDVVPNVWRTDGVHKFEPLLVHQIKKHGMRPSSLYLRTLSPKYTDDLKFFRELLDKSFYPRGWEDHEYGTYEESMLATLIYHWLLRYKETAETETPDGFDRTLYLFERLSCGRTPHDYGEDGDGLAYVEEAFKGLALIYPSLWD